MDKRNALRSDETETMCVELKEKLSNHRQTESSVSPETVSKYFNFVSDKQLDVPLQ